MSMPSIAERARQALRRLREMGFEARTGGKNNPVWYTSVVIAMLVKPGTQKEIVRTAIEVAHVLGHSIEKMPAPEDPYPRFHHGHRTTVEYFNGSKKRNVGKKHTFDDIEPYCDTHHLRSWVNCEDPDDPCDESCAYGLRFI